MHSAMVNFLLINEQKKHKMNSSDDTLLQISDMNWIPDSVLLYLLHDTWSINNQKHVKEN